MNPKKKLNKTGLFIVPSSRAFTGIARKVTVFWVSRSAGAMCALCRAPSVIHLRWVRARISSGHLHPQPTHSYGESSP